MAADVTVNPKTEKSCPDCKAWEKKYGTLLGKRNALRQGIELLGKRNEEVETANRLLQKERDDERRRADNEKEEKEKEITDKSLLEEEISELKSEILYLKEKAASSAEDGTGKVKILEEQVLKGNAQIKHLTELLNKEKGEKEKEITNKALLEKEVSELKSEISSLKEKAASDSHGGSGKVKILEEQILKGDAQTKHLTELLNKEKTRADAAWKNAESEKLQAAAAWKSAEVEKSKAEAERKNYDAERKKSEEYRLQLEKSRKEAEEAKTKLALERVKLEETCTALEAEKRKVCDCTDSEKAKAEEYRLQLEKLRKEANEAKTKLALERVKLEETYNALEAEKKKVCDERQRADSEKAKVEEERKLAEEHQIRLREQKDRVNNMSMVVQECRTKREQLSKEADEARLKLLQETSKCGEVKNKLETEKSKVIEERERADLEKARAMKQQKIAEENERRWMEEKGQADNLFREVEKGRRMIEKLQEELRKLLSSIEVNAGQNHVVNEMDKVDNRLHTLAELVLTTSECLELEKHRPEEYPAVRQADLRTDVAEKPRKRPLEGRSCSYPSSNQSNVEMEKMKERPELEEHASGKIGEAMAAQPRRRNRVAEYEKLNLLRKRLKLEKMKAKHAREVSEFEKRRTRLLVQEVRRAKLDFAELSCRLEELDSCFSPESTGMDEIKKKDNMENMQSRKRLCSFQPLQTNKNKFLNSLSVSITPSDNSQTELSQLASGVNPKDFASGITSKLEFLPGASNRKILQHSAITSAMASFSDKDLVGSQDKGDITMSTASKLVEDNLNQQKDPCSLSDAQDAQMIFNGNLAGVAENTIGIGLNKHCRKRKGLFGDVESIDQLCSENTNLNILSKEEQSILHGTLNEQLEKSSGDAMYLMHELDSPLVVSNVNHQGVQFHGNNEQKKQQVSDVKACQEEISGGPLRGNTREFREDDSVPSENAFDFIFCSGALGGDYMKLLELDNPIDEGEYREAVERPLSPTLPEISLEGIDAVDMDVEEDSFHLWCSEGKNLSFTNVGNVRLDLDRTDCSPRDKGLTVIDDVDKVLPDALPKFCITYSDINDIKAISKTFKAMKKCMDRCSFSSQTDWAVREILVELKAEEELLAKDRICVFFSLLLLNISRAGFWTLGQALNREFLSRLGSFAEHMHGVMSDVEATNELTEFCNIDELLHLIRNFLVDGKLILCHYASPEFSMRGDNIIDMNVGGVDILLSLGAASSDLMVASSIILASICVAVSRINFICETSFQILQTHTPDSQLLLILHVFAYQCGNRYFTQNGYCLLMSVLKSVVLALEMSIPAIDLCPVFGEVTVIKCPFKEEALSLDDVTEKLMEKIQTIAYSTHGTLKHLTEFETLQTKNMIEERSHVDAMVVGDMSSNVLCCSSGAVSPGYVSEGNHGGIMYQLDYLFSMLELIALKKGWEFTRRRIIPLLLKILETRMLESIVTAVVILLGQLGRFGVDAVGYDDEQVENMRCSLQTLLGQARLLKLGFSTQVSIVTALHWLLPHDFETLLQTDSILPDIISLSKPTHKIRDWFSSLTIEEQASMRGLIQANL